MYENGLVKLRNWAFSLNGAVLDMYHEPTKHVVPKLMRGEVAALLDDASIAGIIGAVIAKSYA